LEEVEGDLMGDDLRPFEYRRIWETKPVLRLLYEAYYRKIVRQVRPGRTLEIGAGPGNLKRFMANIVSTDIVYGPWLDAVADAEQLPFRAGSFDTIVLFDVLHHLASPRNFLAEAVRTLKPDGRIVMVEPAITPLSGIFYRLFHPEPVIMSVDPLAASKPAVGRDPWQANQAIPTLLLFRDRERLRREFPALRLVSVRRFGLVSYPLSGGFRSWSLLPARLVMPLLAVETRLEPVLGWLMGFRLIAVLERE